jgi:predicted cytidylate kinase
MRVSISGPPGSGKTTVATLVSKSLRLKLILTGQVFREQARKAGVDVHKYNNMAEKDKSIDEKLDAEILRLAKKSDDVLVEGRLAGHILHSNKVPAFKVFITAPAHVRAKRIAKRENSKWEHEMEKLSSRELSEKNRYKDFYGIDVEDMSIYDLVIDSTDITAEEAARAVIDEVGKVRK